MQCKRILIVEDDDVIRESLQQILENYGYSVMTAADGKVALDHLAALEDEPCLILLDMMMPRMNGWEFLKLRISDPKLLSRPVVVFSAGGDSITEIKSYQAEFLRKPIRMEQLLKTVQKYCGPPSEG